MDATTRVELGENSYDIAIAKESLQQIGTFLRPLDLGQKVLIVSNPEIYGHYGETVVNSLQAAGFSVDTHLIPAGEQYKIWPPSKKFTTQPLKIALNAPRHCSPLGVV